VRFVLELTEDNHQGLGPCSCCVVDCLKRRNQEVSQHVDASFACAASLLLLDAAKKASSTPFLMRVSDRFNEYMMPAIQESMRNHEQKRRFFMSDFHLLLRSNDVKPETINGNKNSVVSGYVVRAGY